MTGLPPIPPRGARRRRSFIKGPLGCGALVLVLALFTWAMETFWTRLDERRFPWLYAKPGRSTLVGTWVGTLTTGGGLQRGVLFDIRIQPLNFGSRRRRRGGRRGIIRRDLGEKLDGSAVLCGAPKAQHFVLNGANATKDASRFTLSFYPADSVPPDGIAPSHMRGTWDLRDALSLEADVYLRRGASAISDGADPNTGRPAKLTMTRGDSAAFRVLCAQRGQGATR